MWQCFLQTTADGRVCPFGPIFVRKAWKSFGHFRSVLGPKIAHYFQGWSFFQNGGAFLDLSGRRPSFTVKPSRICEFVSFLPRLNGNDHPQVLSKPGLCQVHFDFGAHILGVVGSMQGNGRNRRPNYGYQNQSTPIIDLLSTKLRNGPSHLVLVRNYQNSQIRQQQ